MRYRKLSPTGDYVWGQGANSFYINVPEAPAQAVSTRLTLNLGEWFLDRSDGTPWQTQVLGKYTGEVRDAVIKNRALATPGITGLENYSSYVDTARNFSVMMTLTTAYGQVALSGSV